MKSIKIAFYELDSKKDKKGQANFLFNSFPDMLKELSSKLDDIKNKQVIDVDKNGLETSIWFDCFDEQKYFNFGDIYYFLLTKDVISIMKENKKTNELIHQDTIDDDIHLKIPAHFIYFPKNNILAVEEIGTNAPTKAIIERAFKKYLSENIKFEPINRNDVIERLNSFMSAINSVEIDMKNFTHLLKETEANEILNFIRTNTSKLKIKTFLDTDGEKKYIFDLFSRMFYKNAEKEILNTISNMSIKFKNEEMKQEALSLIGNFLIFKKEKEVYLEELQDMNDNKQKRLKYSKSVYQTIIDVYKENYND